MPKDELTAEEIDAMGAEDVAKVTVDPETGVASITPEQSTQSTPEIPPKPAEPPKAEEPAKPPDTPITKAPADKPAEEHPAGPADSKAKTEEPEEPAGTKKPGEEHPKEPKPDPLKDTQKAFHKSREELSQANRKIAELEQEAEKAKIPEFEEQSEDELASMKLESPDDHAEYERNKTEHEKQVKEYQEKKATNVAKLQRLELEPFLKNNHELDFSEDSAKKTAEFLGSEEFEKFNQYVLDNVNPDALGIYSQKKIQDAWDVYDRKGYEARIVAQAKKEQLTELTDLNDGAIFDQATGDRITVETDPAKFDQTRIDAMDEKETEATLKILEAQEGL